MSTTKRCHACGLRVPEDQTTLVRRKVGGNYRRAHVSQPCLICRDCVRHYLPNTVRRGISSYDRWDVLGLRSAGERFGLPVPPRDPQDGAR